MLATDYERGRDLTKISISSLTGGGENWEELKWHQLKLRDELKGRSDCHNVSRGLIAVFEGKWKLEREVLREGGTWRDTTVNQATKKAQLNFQRLLVFQLSRTQFCVNQHS
jgi:hypothetical protein